MSESLAEETGLPYIHFYTPICSHRSKSVTHSMDQTVEDASSDCDSSSDDVFTEEEHTRYMKQLEEGYDITSDSRYNLWLKKRSELVRAQSDVPNNLLLGEAIKSRSVVKKFLPKLPAMRSDETYKRILQKF